MKLLMKSLGIATLILNMSILSSVAVAEDATVPPLGVYTFSLDSPDELTPLDAQASSAGWVPPTGTGLALGNGMVLVTAANNGVRCYTYRDSKPVLLATIQPEKNGAAQIKLSNRSLGLAAMTITWGDNATADFALSLKRGAPLVEVTPAATFETLTINTQVQHWLIPGFAGDDYALSAVDSRPGDKVFLPAERLLLGFQGSGDTTLFLAWPSIDPSLTVTTGSAGIFTELTVKPEGKRFFVGGQALPGQWSAVDVTSAKVGQTTPFDWMPPFNAVWQATLVGPGGVSTWEIIRGNHQLQCGPHGFQVKLPWPFLVNTRVEPEQVNLTLPPDVVHRGKVLRALVYPIRRGKETPATVYLPEDLLSEAFNTGKCAYVQHREWIGTCGGGPLCSLGARVDKLNTLHAKAGRESHYWTQNVDWQYDEGVEQFKRLRQYRELALQVAALCNELTFPANSQGARLQAQILEDCRLIVDSCDAAIRWPMDMLRDWTDFVPPLDATPEEALGALLAAYHQAMKDTDPDAPNRIRDLNGKLRALAVAPQSELPRPRRLAQMVSNNAGLLSAHSEEAAKVATKIRTMTATTLAGKFWSEQGR